MTTAQVVETSFTVNNNSPTQDYVHPDDLTQPFEVTILLFILQLRLLRAFYMYIHTTVLNGSKLMGKNESYVFFLFFVVFFVVVVVFFFYYFPLNN